MRILSAVRTKHTRLATAAMAALLTLSLTACGNDEPSGGDATKLEGISLVKDGQLTICTHLPYKPFQYKEGNEVVGFDVDLLKLLSDDLGLKQEVVNIEWAQITSGAAFSAKKCDVGMGAMTITDKRKGALTITDPYMDATQVLMVKKDSAIKSLADLKGKKLGAQADTTGEKYAFAARKDDPSATKLVTKFNELLAKAKSDGKYDEIYKKWFGVAPKK